MSDHHAIVSADDLSFVAAVPPSLERVLQEVTIDEIITQQVPETLFEFYSDAILGTAFLVTAIIAAKRMSSSRSQGGAETTVVTAFYSLILLTALLRTIWFMVPQTYWAKSYTPQAVMAFDPEHPDWVNNFLEILILGAGSLCLFSIFILILVYWADILKKYFYPGARRSKPMVTFLVLVAVLMAVQIINAAMFLLGKYSTEGMILVNAITMSLVSIVCVCEITIFSHRFRTVLKTLGAINQVSTESQVKRIVWITVTGNLFFLTRAFMELVFAIFLIVYWQQTGSVSEVFSHALWDTYILLKHWSELAILGLMLYILQSRFTTNAVVEAAEGIGSGKEGYQAVPGNDDDAPIALNV